VPSRGLNIKPVSVAHERVTISVETHGVGRQTTDDIDGNVATQGVFQRPAIVDRCSD
jgi:hypothetical protein